MNWQNLNEEHENYLRSKVVAVARNIANGELGIVAGARKFGKYTHPTGVGSDPDFIFFIGVDCETDSFPLGEVRQLWKPEELQIKDQELAVYEGRIRERTLEVCRRLIQKYTANQSTEYSTALAMSQNARIGGSIILRS